MEDFKIYIVAIWKISEYTYSLYKNPVRVSDFVIRFSTHL